MTKKPEYKMNAPKWFTHYFMPACTLTGLAIAYLVIKHPERAADFGFRTRNVQQRVIRSATSIPDSNGDRIPELRVQYSDGSLDTLLSHVKDGKIVYEQ